MEKISDFKERNFTSGDYVSLSDFRSFFLPRKSPLPYQSDFALDIMLNHLKEKLKVANFSEDSPLNLLFQGMIKGLNSWQQAPDHPDSHQLIDALTSLLLFDDERSFIGFPFARTMVYQSPSFQDFFNSDEWEVMIETKLIESLARAETIHAGAFILQKCYGQGLKDFHSESFSLRNKKNGLHRYFNLHLRFDYIEVIPLKPIKKLSQEEINLLLCNFEDESLWLKYLPPENFAFKGFAIGKLLDNTKKQVLENLREISSGEMKYATLQEMLESLRTLISSFLQAPSLKVGWLELTFLELAQRSPFSLSGSNDLTDLVRMDHKHTPGGIYQEALTKKDVVFVSNLDSLEHPSEGEKRLIKAGLKSVILIPLLEADGKVKVIIEIGSQVAYAFNMVVLIDLAEFFELVHEISVKMAKIQEDRTNLFIQQEFTSIHPSVKWKFVEAATHYLIGQHYDGFEGGIPPIVFNDVYPLYGQSDIVRSSTLRNKAIQADLLENLHRVDLLMTEFLAQVDFYLLAAYQMKVQAWIRHLEEEFNSSDEFQVVDLLTAKVHPLLEELVRNFPQIIDENYAEYLGEIDAQLGFIYKKRKAYENSVTRLNQSLGQFLEEEDDKIQAILPHYIEKYQTDGVEYNIYVGESISPENRFSEHYLKSFRLWQLVKMVEVTQLVHRLGPELEVPLQTAQLIFVYSNSLSIRFRMDEKQFDVDGAYNVRYEILKKRIDKALVKGSRQRLTLAGRIAIVYLQEEDRDEYLEYLEYLKQKDYIEDEIEDLDLEKLQGADGLKALRVTVKVE